ncbi:Hypothetical protein DHA2_153402 [Giardia duodenalis]|uniref:Uncharacterized protein n=1 Tax=Giardia intestinalis TaxID=5741 RepID=V6TCV9_GIAIN|nr:Hypothetical protein DHA2_153402 [Giardia intestinalis]
MAKFLGRFPCLLEGSVILSTLHGKACSSGVISWRGLVPRGSFATSSRNRGRFCCCAVSCCAYGSKVCRWSPTRGREGSEALLGPALGSGATDGGTKWLWKVLGRAERTPRMSIKRVQKVKTLFLCT